MWRLKHGTSSRLQGPLENKTIDVGKLKLHVKSTIAQGGFSYVYIAKCVQSQRTYALKHIIATDTEGSDLVEKEISVMMSLRGHPHIVTLHAHGNVNDGRRVEYYLAMDYCEKMLVNVMESRGKNFFDEKQLLLIFRDVCDAVYAMHSRSPPIAHRDLKAENVLLGNDGLWKLCDFGSSSTNHKRFETAEEMGREEDNIRKHTTPAYRAPEMWDLYARELISEKVDIWALGCLLFRMAYFKSCFDGDSKLQILNRNYRIPEAPRYSVGLVSLIHSMLNASPEKRPSIVEVWKEVNSLLPPNVRKLVPAVVPMAPEPSTFRGAGKGTSQPSPPHRAPSPGPRSSRSPSPGHRPPITRPLSPTGLPPIVTSRPAAAAPAGSFWAAHYTPASPIDSSPRSPVPPASPPRAPSPAPENFQQPTSPVSPQPFDPDRQSNVACRRAASWTDPDPIVEINGEGIPAIVVGVAYSHSTQPSPQELSPPVLSPRAAPWQVPRAESLVIEESQEKPRQHRQQLGGGVGADAVDRDLEPWVPAGNRFVDDRALESDQLRAQLARLQVEKAELESKCERLASMVRSQRTELQELRALVGGSSSRQGVSPRGTAVSPGVAPERGAGHSSSPPPKQSGGALSPRRPEEQVSSFSWVKQNQSLPSDGGHSSGAPAVPLSSQTPPQPPPVLPGWASFDDPNLAPNAQSNGFRSSPANGSGRAEEGEPGWAPFGSPTVSQSGISSGGRQPAAGHTKIQVPRPLPPVQWEAVVNTQSKAATSNRSTPPAGWAAF